MLRQEYTNSSGDMWDELKSRAGNLLDKIELGNSSDISEAIAQLHETRDQSIYREVGQLTRGLHDAIANFDLDTGKAVDGESCSQMTNILDCLDYVVKLTQTSADKTMDMVEEGIPVASQIADGANALREDWERLIRREMDSSEFKGLCDRVDQFLALSVDNSTQLNGKLNEILLAQDFQDLTGQVIKKVSSLVQGVEERLVDLMRVASQVEQFAGIVNPVEHQDSAKNNAKSHDVKAEGPHINAEQRDDVVSNQDDVDDLLSSLGF